jgi:hypothetical protein
MLGLFGLFSAGVYGAAMPRSDLFEFDAAWKPELPVGGHTYSGEWERESESERMSERSGSGCERVTHPTTPTRPTTRCRDLCLWARVPDPAREHVGLPNSCARHKDGEVGSTVGEG